LNIEQSTYEILRERLVGQAGDLRARAERLNEERLALFGGAALEVIGNERIRTENNCVPRDIVTVGDYLLFGYNVFIGLRTETNVQDVLSLHSFKAGETGFSFDRVPDDHLDNFLGDPRFVKDFKELYRYYRETRLIQLRRLEGRLLAVFQTGAGAADIKVFRWSLDAAGKAGYLDNRGERDHVFPPSHDFEWTASTRDDHVLGRHPHISILDQVFVETIGGDLTVKVEDNTEDGQGIYSEPVDERNQSLADSQVHYARVGVLILLKILPYNEKTWRYLVFNSRSRSVVRLDAIGHACLLLPEDHGIIFPGGFYLQTGDQKAFAGDVAQMEFLRAWRSPNGEDVLYVFYERASGRSILLPYNLIRKEVAAPIHCNGMALFGDGKLVLFRATSDEPTRIHPMQIWQTPFWSDVHAAQALPTGGFLEKIGNAELVRGISEALSLTRAAIEQTPSVAGYEELIAGSVRFADAYHWLGSAAAGNLAEPLAQLRQTADAIVGEFAKVESLRADSVQALAASEQALGQLFQRLRTQSRQQVDHFVGALAELRQERGKLIALRERRYIDLAKVDALEQQLVERQDALAAETVRFLLGDQALLPYHRQLAEVEAQIEPLTKTADGKPLAGALDGLAGGLDLLTEVVGALKIDDPTHRTQILEKISEVLAVLNRVRALLAGRRKELATREGTAEFGAQFNLLTQSVTGALALAETPEQCDEQLSRLLLQVEELEGRFSEVDSFVEQLTEKRDDVYEAFTARKQTLLDERQRRAARLVTAADRILEGIRRRSSAMASTEELNAYFVADAMVAKLRDLGGQLREIGSGVKADELDLRLKAAREEATRTLRDRREIFEDGAAVLRFGQHRFTVNSQPFDLTLVPREVRQGETELALHLTATDFYERIDDPALAGGRDYWDQVLASETPDVYRAEWLAASLLFAAEAHRDGLSLDRLRAATLESGGVAEIVRQAAAARYDEGYERGLHDHDAAALLEALIQLYTGAGLLRFAPRPRALAALFWAFATEGPRRPAWQRRARSLGRLRHVFAPSAEIARLADELATAIGELGRRLSIEIGDAEARLAGLYLFEELAAKNPTFATSAEALALRDAFLRHLDQSGQRQELDDDLREPHEAVGDRFHLACAWLRGFLDQNADPAAAASRPSLEEAAVLLLAERRLERRPAAPLAARDVGGLLGQHSRVVDRRMTLRLDEFLTRLARFRDERVPAFRAFQATRHQVLARARERLRLEELKPKVMSAFVRNRLINDVYLPLIGANLAKQLGTVGAGKRTDQMGLLLLVSPPGYGKTTLMEYVANRLGLAFVKVNGPALGHQVKSVDPADAPNATARQEVEKINFALEMGNNVLLYLDDIQHTDPELLQKFISLCDAQRKIEGVWQGRTRTYDLRGKRFAICMAGNPYTESGARFKIPDMLANRADTYNLGEILQGKDEIFALSFIENALTSNPVLAPLAGREPADVFTLVRMAQGEPIQADQLVHPYGGVELEELLSVLRQLLRIREVALKVNRQYIASAAQDDAFRTEPRFQLQGSYRNMNKMAERVLAVMNDAELERLIDDHYAGEAQTLTTGAEHNLLKLAELRGRMTEAQQRRWQEILRGFARVQTLGGAEEDPAVRLIGQLSVVSERLQDIDRAIGTAAESASRRADAPQPPPQIVVESATPQIVVEAPQVTVTSSGLDIAGWQRTLEPLIGRFERSLGRLAVHPGQTDAASENVPTKEAIAPIVAPVIDLVGVVEALAPYLDRLEGTLRGMGSAPGRGVQAEVVVQSLGPGVVELLERLGQAVSDELMPLVQGLGRQLKAAGNEDRRMLERLNRTLKSLDLLRDLVLSLRKIDTQR
jgi:hypothetical protein